MPSPTTTTPRSSPKRQKGSGNQCGDWTYVSSPQQNSSRREAGESHRMRTQIGVWALQGDVAEHIRAIESCGANAGQVGSRGDLEQVGGIILPGGEDPTIGKML